MGDNDALQQAVIDALVYRTCGDAERALSALDVIFDHGDGGMYSAMCAWAEAVRLIGLTDDTPGRWALEVDGPGGVDTAPRGPVFAARFVAAWANGDRDMTWDMFLSCPPTEEGAKLLADGMVTLLDLASATVQAKGC